MLEYNNSTVKAAQKILLDILLVFDKICRENNIKYWLDAGTLLGAYRHKGFIPWDDDIDVCVPIHDYKRLIPLLKDFCDKSENHILYFSDVHFGFFYEYFADTSFLYNGVFPLRIDIMPIKTIKNNEQDIKIDKSLLELVKLYVIGKEVNYDNLLEEHRKFLPVSGIPLKERNEFFKFYDNYMLTYNYDDSINKDFLITTCVSDTFAKKEKDYFHINDINPLNEIDFEGGKFYGPNNTEKYLEYLYGDYMKIPPKEKRLSNIKLLHKNKIPKHKIKDFIEKFHYYGFVNYLIGDKNKNKNKKWRMIKSLIILSVYLIRKLRFKSFRNLITYSLYKAKK